MINDPTDLEPLLAQYDPGTVLVGPLLNLSINSSFRFFYIAGNGSKKICESISLGFVEVEADAQSQRADIVARLENRFGEVQVLGSQLELAETAHSLWPNEATTRFLATATLEAKLQPTRAVVRDKGFDIGSDIGLLSSDRGQPVVGKGTGDAVAHGDSTDPSLNYAQPSARDRAQPAALADPAVAPRPLRLPDANAIWPLNCDPAVPPEQRHSARKRDDIALAVLGLKSSTETVAGPPVDGAKSSASILYALRAIGGAAALVAAVIVLASTRQTADEAQSVPTAAQFITVDHDNDSSQTAAAVTHSIPPNQIAKAKDAASQSKPAPIAVPRLPPAQTPEIARPPTAAAPVSTPQSPPSPAASAQLWDAHDGSQSPPSQVTSAQTPAAHDQPKSNAPEAPPAQTEAMPISQPQLPPAASVQVGTVHGGPQPLQSQGASAQIGAVPDTPPSPAPEAPRVQAGAAAVFEPQSPPSRAANAQAEIVPHGPGSPSQVASAQVGEAAVSGPQPPRLKGGTTATPLSADEIAARVSRSSDFLKNGDFAAARLLLRRAAESGSANAALMLGKTFDPLYLNELGAVGIQSDIEQCRLWYEKAAELGSAAAAQRLANLAKVGQ
jgi:hypothetical protein